MRLRIFCDNPACGCPVDVDATPGNLPAQVTCPACKTAQAPLAPSLPPSPEGSLERCPRCGGEELYIRKDFPQKLGLLLVALAGLSSVILFAMDRLLASMGVLIAVVILDAIIYGFVPKLTACYRCKAEMRDLPVNPAHAGFDLATAEKYR